MRLLLLFFDARGILFASKTASSQPLRAADTARYKANRFVASGWRLIHDLDRAPRKKGTHGS